jgi:hypothetical protein
LGSEFDNITRYGLIDRVRVISYRGRQVWQHHGNMGWQFELARFIRHLFRVHGFKTPEATRIIREMPPLELTPTPIVSTRFVHRKETIAFVAASWVGQRYGTEAKVRAWLRSCGFNPAEIESLLIFADTKPVTAREVKTLRALANKGPR